MKFKPDYIENPIDGSPMFRNPAPISFVILFIISMLLYRQFKDTSDNTYIRQNQWKYFDGYSVGDFLNFENSNYLKLRNDTIFKSDTAIAIIQIVDKHVISDNKLIIKSILSGQLGSYCEK